ncbi:MAG: hypothetical protein BWY76_00248 [bacterium ADurb.Bin429]|nr:MAG: hypothetical protein BWY76_00248 [bacterium ADurb.Bin429]
MKRPDGSVIRPRIPASCTSWRDEPRAPDCAIIISGLNGSSDLAMAFHMSSVARDQSSQTRCERSPSLMTPRWK